MGKKCKKFKTKIFRYRFMHDHISFFQYFSDFCPKIESKFDHFLLNFEFHPSLLIRFSDPEIPIVLCRPLFASWFYSKRFKINSASSTSSLIQFPCMRLFFFLRQTLGPKHLFYKCAYYILVKLIFLSHLHNWMEFDTTSPILQCHANHSDLSATFPHNQISENNWQRVHL